MTGVRRNTLTHSVISNLLLALLIGFSTTLQAQNKRLDEPPRLVIQIVMGSVSLEAINHSWEELAPDGLVRTMERGVICQNAQQSQLISNAANALATLVSGTDASRHGVVSTKWYSQVTGAAQHLTEDAQEHVIGTARTGGGHSPRQLPVSTLSETWRMAHPEARIYSIALTPSEAVILGGRAANAALWLDNSSGNFVSSSFYCDSLPAWATAYNHGGLATLYLGQKWFPFRSQSNDSLHLHPEGHFMEKTLYGPKFTRLQSIPQGNTLTKDLMVRAIEDDSLGRRNAPDLLSVHFTALENISTLYGASSRQMKDALQRFDSEFANLLDYLNATVGAKKYLIILTAAYTPEIAPNELAAWRIPSGRFNPDRAVVMLNTFYKAFYKVDGLVLGHSGQQFYLNLPLIENSRLPLKEVEEHGARFLQNMSGVSKVYPSHILEFASFSDERSARILSNYHPKRSGNLLVDLQPGWVVETTISPQAEGSDISYNARIPLIFYGWKFGRKRVSTPVYLRDIAATLCEIYSMPLPNASSGSPIPGVANWE